MKRICSLLLALVMVIGLFPAVHAATTESGLEYEVCEDHVEITGYTGSATEVVIPNEIEGLPVTVISGLRNYHLTGITLPDSLLSIGDNAFFDCESLTELTIPETVSEIGRYVFQGCDNLVNIHVAEGNTCYFSVDGVLYLRPDMISGNPYPDPNRIALKCCPGGKTYLSLPEYVQEITIDALDFTEKLEHIDAAPENEYFCAVDGVLYSKDMTVLIRYPQKRQGNFIIPVGVETIMGSAFLWCQELTGVTIPETVTAIESHAFYGCTKLPAVTIPDGITSIREMTFQHCNSLSKVNLPDSLKTIERGGFCGCDSLTEIIIPDYVTEIGSNAFNLCRSLTTVYLPRQLQKLDSWALAQCHVLESVYFSGNAPIFSQNTFHDSTFTAYYPANNSTWTEEVRQNYDGTVTWVPYTANPFTDVPLDSYYEAPVLWALENGITTGASATSFNPGGDCLRAQVVTFLHRAEGNPAPTSTKNPFTDVKTSDYFYKPVLWAVEKGITTGVSSTKFGARDVCSRAAVVTFLWRAAGSPEPQSTSNPFTDVPADSYYEDAVLWAVENGITTGVDATHFGPANPCNRAQVVTFLYRAYN